MSLTVQQQMLVEQRLANDKKSTLVAYLLWFFFWGLGAHRFYLGRTGSGIAMLLLTLLGILTSVIYVGLVIIFAVAVWALVDAFLIPGMIDGTTREARQRIATEVQAVALGS